MMDNKVKDKFLGSGLLFPIELNSMGRPDPVSDINLIRASIAHIINWPQRERFFNEDFGCRVYEVLEEPDDNISRTLIRYFIMEALEKWEKRIEVLDVQRVGNQPTVMNIQITYKIRSTKEEETYIYPFYKEIIH